MEKKRTAAIVLAAGRGRRMESDIPKQYLKIGEFEVIYYTLAAFEQSMVDEVILVTGEEEIPFCQKEIVDKYGFKKVAKIVAGGAERYDSVYQGILAAGECDLILIHDGARPLVTPEIIAAVAENAALHRNCTTGMPVKDTIKIADAEQFAADTPDRSRIWAIHTPQGFTKEVIVEAHERFRKDPNPGPVTDDTMLVEKYMEIPTKLVAGSYKNIKVTTPEDIFLAKVLMQ